jgi:hypothetical protein
MIGKAEVIVGAEVDHRSAISQMDMGPLGTVDESFFLEEAFAADDRQLVSEGFSETRCHDGLGGSVPLSGRNLTQQSFQIET